MPVTNKIILISGDGIGAGKTHLAKCLGVPLSLADSMRQDLAELYPDYDWFRKDQHYKETTRVAEFCDGGLTMRQVMIEYGGARTKIDPTYWANRLIGTIIRQYSGGAAGPTLAVDDVRYLLEVTTFRANPMFMGGITHIHLHNPRAKPEPQFEAEALRKAADYAITWPATALHGGAET